VKTTWEFTAGDGRVSIGAGVREKSCAMPAGSIAALIAEDEARTRVR